MYLLHLKETLSKEDLEATTKNLQDAMMKAGEKIYSNLQPEEGSSSDMESPEPGNNSEEASTSKDATDADPVEAKTTKSK